MDSKELKTGRYKHYKGNLYDVYEVATHSEDESKLWFTAHATAKKRWVRPLICLLSRLKRRRNTPRFAYVKIPDDENDLIVKLGHSVRGL